MIKAQDYIANADCWIAGRRVHKCQRISMTPHQARYEPVSQAAPNPPRRNAKGEADA